MTKATALEVVAGGVLIGVGSSAYFGWAPVTIAFGVVLVVGVVVQVAMTRRRPVGG